MPSRDDDDLADGSARVRRGLVVLGWVVTLAVGTAYVTAGPAGLLIALSVVAVSAVVGVMIGVPTAPPVRRRGRPLVPVDNAPYRNYRQVAEKMSWAQVSPRHFDLATRPLLWELLASRLADRHRVDLYLSPERARAIVGDDEVWRLLDPARPANPSGQPPGTDLRTLDRIVSRLEEL